ncbi:NADH pyrophosphatase [Spathaspora sp. JA1]|nr:NADH pyrophosphatase [Spathaspora sp. JA1]
MSHSRTATFTDVQQDMYFGTEVVNRVSFLREDSEFITQSLFHPSTRFIFYQDQKPLIHKNFSNKLTILTNGSKQLSIDTISNGKIGFTGEPAIIETGLMDSVDIWKSVLTTWNSDNKTQASDLRQDTKPIFLFLGLLDESVGLDLHTLKFDDSDQEKFLDHQGRYQGIAYYAVDLTNSPELTDSIINFVNDYINRNYTKGIVQTPEENGLFFTHSRKHYLGFENKEASLFSQGAMFFSWLEKNKFCPGCGHPVIPIHAGGKLYCTNTTMDQHDPEKFACPVKSAPVANVSFPRTDMAIITTIANRDRSKILLSLSKRYAITKMYSCTAGFMEPSETVEVATKREIWEETGVTCSEIDIMMTQPWPFPSNLMIGCMGIVDFNGTNEQIHLGHDNELSDARWFDIEFVKKLVYPKEQEDEDFNPEGIVLPMPESIAFQLIKLVVDEATNKHKL